MGVLEFLRTCDLGHFLSFERMNAAAPEGTPPRRISDKEIQKLPAPLCLGEALMRGTLQKNVIISKENDVIQKTWDKVKSKIALSSALYSL